MLDSYRNKFYDARNPYSRQMIYGAEFVETYKGYDLYRQSDIQTDAVVDGECVSSCVTVAGMKRHIDGGGIR